MEASVKQVNAPGKFGKTTRHYEINGKKYPSVTSILGGAVAKPALINWAAKVEREACIATAWDIYSSASIVKLDRDEFANNFSLRLGKEKAHSREMTAAADIGTQAHKRIEWEMRRDLKLEVGPAPPCSDPALWAAMAFSDWRKASNFSPFFCEQIVYSERYGYAGTADWAGEINGDEKRLQVLGDTKSGKAIYAEALLQNAAYVHAAVEMGQLSYPMAGIIVRVPKTLDDPAFEARIIPAEDQKRLFKVFLSVLELWKFLEEQK